MSPGAQVPLGWASTPFASLAVPDLYDLLQLRSEVFVVEQACLFQDMDGADAQAIHLLGRQGGQLVAYARCFPAGVTFAEASIGRVATRLSARGGGLGHRLMEQAMGLIVAHWGPQAIRIGAQAHLKHFYSAHGFIDVGKPYVEDGIDHLEMLRPFSQPGVTL